MTNVSTLLFHSEEQENRGELEPENKVREITS